MQALRKMSETEKQIMMLIWQAEELPVTASEVQQLAGDVKEWKHTTIATFLQKLCQKGVLRVVKKGNTNLYYPLVTEEEYLRFETMTFLQEVHKGSLKSFMSALCGQESERVWDEAELAKLQKMIEDQQML